MPTEYVCSPGTRLLSRSVWQEVRGGHHNVRSREALSFGVNRPKSCREYAAPADPHRPRPSVRGVSIWKRAQHKDAKRQTRQRARSNRPRDLASSPHHSSLRLPWSHSPPFLHSRETNGYSPKPARAPGRSSRNSVEPCMELCGVFRALSLSPYGRSAVTAPRRPAAAAAPRAARPDRRRRRTTQASCRWPRTPRCARRPL
mmetsp:Transcript_48503/g.105153  ORF Transcript_48503/g.105153 Transcript_48503/m.105153 type:complete len:201 (-) Transcript_48503:824-1426(-)